MSPTSLENGSEVIVWSGNLLSIPAGRKLLFGIILFMVAVEAFFTGLRAAQGRPLWKEDDAVPLVLFAINLAMLTIPKPQGVSRDGVGAISEAARPWSEVRRAWIDRDHVIFDFGKPFWHRPWLILPADRYERARVLLLLHQKIPADRLVRRDG